MGSYVGLIIGTIYFSETACIVKAFLFGQLWADSLEAVGIGLDDWE